MSKYQREKGASFERDRANWWKALGWEGARRKLSQYQETDGQDLENTYPFVEQCKVGCKINILAAYKEAKSAKQVPVQIPIAAIKYDRQETLIVMSETDFERMLKKDW